MLGTVLHYDVNGIKEIGLEPYELANRIIWISSEITVETANLFIRKLNYLNLENQRKPIKLFITSNGGSVEDGLAIYDAMTSSKAPIYTCAVARAYSMGAVLLTAGKKRFSLPHSQIMLHRPLVRNPQGGNESDIAELSKSLKRYQQQLNEILSHHTNHTVKEIERAIKYDHYFTAEEAKDFNLIDNVIDYNDFVLL